MILEKRFIIILLLWVQAPDFLNALSCYTCSAGYDENDETSCFRPIAGITQNTTCFEIFSPAYCLTTVTLNEGRAYISRSCETWYSSSTFEEVGLCRVTARLTLASTTCEYRCDDDYCNAQQTTDLTPCVGCSPSRGICNTLTGECSCFYSNSGPSCEARSTAAPAVSATVAPISYRKCVQCNSETDKDCEKNTAATDCEYLHTRYCLTTKSWQIENTGQIVKTTITRGCAASSIEIRDRCHIKYFSSVRYPADYTCVSFCDSDGCNTATLEYPPSQSSETGNTKRRLQCVQTSCSGEQPGCGFETARSDCYSDDAAYCFSRVTYIAPRDDELADLSQYSLQTVTRGCRSEPLTAECTRKQIGNLSLYWTECAETCSVDGCNTGWPTRPKCMQCNDEEPCFPTPCPNPHDKYCVLLEHARNGRKDNENYRGGYPEKVTYRFCSPKSIGTACTSYKYHTETFYDCNRTCTEDGCNAGSDAAIEVLSMAVLVFSLLASVAV